MDGLNIMQNTGVFMVGWEYPPHNSGGLGVACQGLTEALHEHGTKLHFSLPYQSNISVNHMQVHVCRDPSWDTSSTSDGAPHSQSHDVPPFFAYGQEILDSQSSLYSPVQASQLYDFDVAALRVAPTTQLENQVTQYAHAVSSAASAVRGSFDVIHAHDWMSFPAAVDIKQKTKKPFIAHVHSTEYDRAGLQQGNPYITAVEQQGMLAADHIIAVSYYTKHLLEQKYNIDPRKISVVHNGIAPLATARNSDKKSSFAQDRPAIVFMGRLTLQKGVTHFLDLARSVLRTMPEALFILAGDGDMGRELLFTAARQHLSAHVLFSGFLRDSERNRLLDRADVFVMPSISEPFGLVALEAAQRNTPVIISKNAGVSEVLPHAIALDFWDINAMTRSITDLVTKPRYAENIIAGQQRDLSQQTWQLSAQKVLAIYRQVFSGKPSSRR